MLAIESRAPTARVGRRQVALFQKYLLMKGSAAVREEDEAASGVSPAPVVPRRATRS